MLFNLWIVSGSITGIFFLLGLNKNSISSIFLLLYLFNIPSIRKQNLKEIKSKESKIVISFVEFLNYKLKVILIFVVKWS